MHLNRLNGYDISEAEHYHEKCIELLLPILSDKKAIMDGAVLASSVLLRFYKEISTPIRGKDHAWHLLGGFAFVAEANKESRHWSDGLGSSAFWIHQRQDIINAILNQRSTKADLRICRLDRSPSYSSPEVWAKRSQCLAADVVSFCFGQEVSSVDRYNELKYLLEEWDCYKPSTSGPFLASNQKDHTQEQFPELIFTLDASVIGVAYFHLSMLLMTIYNPSQPKMGPSCVKNRLQVESEVRFRVQSLCGIALSNPCPPGRVVACLAISECGSWFRDPGEQEQLLNVVQLVEREDGWPGEATIASLKEQWNLCPMGER